MSCVTIEYNELQLYRYAETDVRNSVHMETEMNRVIMMTGEGERLNQAKKDATDG